MVAVAAVVVAAGTATGMVSALGAGTGADAAAPRSAATTAGPVPPSAPSPTATVSATAAPSPSVSSSAPPRTSARPEPSRTGTVAKRQVPTVSSRLHRHPDSQVLDWVHAHPGDPRTPVIASRVAAQPAAVWFADYSPSTITARVRAVTSAAGTRVPVLVPYAIPDRDCGGASEGGAPGLKAYDAWIDAFAAGLGSGEVVVVLEPDSVAQSDCLPEAGRAGRFASLARAGRVLKTANPHARVYYDAGHSHWNPAQRQAALLKQAGAASPASSDGVFSNVSNFRTTADETAYDRRVLDALGGPASLGAVIDTSRNGNGAPPDGQWCDPPGRRIGRAPTLATGEARIDAYLWVKAPGESDGCRGEPGTFKPSYAYDLAR
ncbi:glycoside hydrolase family 6 protein [Streptomyces kebangsaanensis]|uniref:glycoside hydrolase family 6 protein n=1 Tax=Streptomyces kebangsaanensis TaxID=864058 RepID=UPI00093AE534|nr:glycoside hydrolase family 6 protein [Streptomyces kebangsaanensis]